MGNWENDNRNSGDNVNGRPLNNGNGSNPSPDNNNKTVTDRGMADIIHRVTPAVMVITADMAIMAIIAVTEVTTECLTDRRGGPNGYGPGNYK